MLDGLLEENIDAKNISSHTKILARKPRYRKLKEERWNRLTSEDLDNLSLNAMDDIREKIMYYEGDVDTVETFDNPDETKREPVVVDLMSEISFFYPRGRV